MNGEISVKDRRSIVYVLLQLVPMGKVVTYKALAELLGCHPRAVAAFMRANRNPIVIPCHRVVMNDGSLGGYSRGGPRVKERLLRLEGVEVVDGRVSEKCIIRSGWDLLRVDQDRALEVDVD